MKRPHTGFGGGQKPLPHPDPASLRTEIIELRPVGCCLAIGLFTHVPATERFARYFERRDRNGLSTQPTTSFASCIIHSDGARARPRTRSSFRLVVIVRSDATRCNLSRPVPSQLQRAGVGGNWPHAVNCLLLADRALIERGVIARARLNNRLRWKQQQHVDCSLLTEAESFASLFVFRNHR